jgi:hypothetical protein
MPVRFLNPVRIYYLKILFISAAILLLLLKSEQHYSNILLVTPLLFGGYYLGKVTCSIHFKNLGVGITILVFILMNVVHSFIDGVSFSGQAFFYWLGAIGGHELIRQPTLYIVLWAILQPIESNKFVKIIICFISVTIVWLIGIWLGKLSGASVSHLYNFANWIGYSIFLFVGDIVHHLADQYSILKKQKITR